MRTFGVFVSCAVLAGATQSPESEARPATVILVGTTGSGKSNVANFLAGQPEAFVSQSSKESVTTQASSLVANWYGGDSKQGQVRIVDTPGLGDTKGSSEDNAQWNSAVEYLMEDIKTADLILLVENSAVRFTQEQRKIVKNLRLSFGPAFWQHVAIFCTRWRKPFAQLEEEKSWYMNKIAELDREVQLEQNEKEPRPVNVTNIRLFGADLIPSLTSPAGIKKMFFFEDKLTDKSLSELVDLDYKLHQQGIDDFRNYDQVSQLQQGTEEMQWVMANKHGLYQLELLRQAAMSNPEALNMDLSELQDYGVPPHMLGIAAEIIRYLEQLGVTKYITEDEMMRIMGAVFTDPTKAYNEILTLTLDKVQDEIVRHLEPALVELSVEPKVVLNDLDLKHLYEDPVTFLHKVVHNICQEVRQKLIVHLKPIAEEFHVRSDDWITTDDLQILAEQWYNQPKIFASQVVNRTADFVQRIVMRAYSPVLAEYAIDSKEIFAGDELKEVVVATFGSGVDRVEEVGQELLQRINAMLRVKGIGIQRAIVDRLQPQVEDLGADLSEVFKGTELQRLPTEPRKVGEEVLQSIADVLQQAMHDHKVGPWLRSMGMNDTYVLDGLDLKVLVLGSLHDVAAFQLELLGRIASEVHRLVKLQLDPILKHTNGTGLDLDQVVTGAELHQWIATDLLQNPKRVRTNMVSRTAKGLQLYVQTKLDPLLSWLNVTASELLSGNEAMRLAETWFEPKVHDLDTVRREIGEELRQNFIAQADVIQSAVQHILKPAMERFGVRMENLFQGQELQQLIESGNSSDVGRQLYPRIVKEVDRDLRVTLQHVLAPIQHVSVDDILGANETKKLADMLVDGDIIDMIDRIVTRTANIFQEKILGVIYVDFVQHAPLSKSFRAAKEAVNSSQPLQATIDALGSPQAYDLASVSEVAQGSTTEPTPTAEAETVTWQADAQAVPVRLLRAEAGHYGARGG
eukprot:CAMPEP_0204275782 /NCGR_PEP_ID=MMETSP0468-20130131/26703_1 /ASSEMBLY_ACC=CAM_ASM_000383 /TAXON_ID=2969 /ORGANISM="Oxyrrhis marina" /LENGTH=967 /DNA_ID=CAMNT_0051252215 /DNA_START=86 /DNA_END=2989 /DNA_ORIENTATION=+